MARCPECGHKLSLREDLERWDHVYCDACHAELEILALKPLELEAVFDFEDDPNDLEVDVDDDEDLMDDEDWDEDESDEDDDDDW